MIPFSPLSTNPFGGGPKSTCAPPGIYFPTLRRIVRREDRSNAVKWRRTLLSLLTVAVLAGCGRGERTSPPAASPKKETLLIGLIPERNIFKQFERHEPLAAYLSTRTGVDVKLKALAHYGNVIENFESLKLDGAFFGSFGYSLAHARLGVEVLARPETLDGISTYRGLMFVRKDSGITSIAKMKGKRLALVARATAAGCLFPLVRLHEAGVTKPEAYFSEVYYAGSHDGTIRDVLEGKADVGASKDSVFRELAAADPRVERELRIVAESVAVPENALAVRRTIDPAVKKKVLDALITMHEVAEGKQVLERFGARRFVETTDADYAPVLKYSASIGIDLATYDFTNAQ